MQVKGVVVEIHDTRTGGPAEKPWQAKTFVINVPGQYPYDNCVTLFGDKVEWAKNLVVGNQVEIEVNVKSKKNAAGYWNTSLDCYKMQILENEFSTQGNAGTQATEPSPIADGDLPF